MHAAAAVDQSTSSRPAPRWAPRSAASISAHLDDAAFAAIQHAWHDHPLLLFRGQDAHRRRPDRLQPPLRRPRPRADPGDTAGASSRAARKSTSSPTWSRTAQPIGSLGAGEAVWHTDMSYLRAPPKASMLYALEVPPAGGNTSFCDMYAAYEALPDALQRAHRGPAGQARRHLQQRRLSCARA